MPEPALFTFIEESNRIEGIHRPPSRIELQEYERLLHPDGITVGDMQRFATAIAGARLRDRPGLNVRVGGFVPPPGGPAIREALSILLAEIAEIEDSPYYAHCRYETLHPFTDGNGRSGRALWAWHMRQVGQDPFALPFLHRFYYQSLAEFRA